SKSECAIQADMIRRLAKLGVRRIVLPLPMLANLPGPADMLNPFGPQPNSASIERSKKDLPALLEAMRAAKCVTLAIPRRMATAEDGQIMIGEAPPKPGTANPTSQAGEDRFWNTVDPIATAARDHGDADLEAYGSAVLTSVSTKWD